MHRQTRAPAEARSRSPASVSGFSVSPIKSAVAGALRVGAVGIVRRNDGTSEDALHRPGNGGIWLADISEAAEVGECRLTYCGEVTVIKVPRATGETNGGLAVTEKVSLGPRAPIPRPWRVGVTAAWVNRAVYSRMSV